MTWRDRYQTGSYRGVSFKLRSASTTAGRRTVVHEFAQRDEPITEDMGRAARRFTVEALIVGPDYDQDRDRLIAALEARGPGLLVHPLYGRRTVALASPARISESPTDQGRQALFSLDFVEAGADPQPSTRADTAATVASAASAASSATRSAAARDIRTAGQPDFVRANLATAVRTALDAVQAARRGLLSDVGVAVEFNAEVRNFTGQIAAVLNTPADLAQRVQDVVAGLRGLAVLPAGALASLRTLWGFRLSGSGSGTPARAQNSANLAALSTLVSSAAVIESAQAVASLDFDSYDQAVALRDEIGDQLDALMDSADDTVYPSLAALRVALVQDVATRGADLARIAHHTPAATLPALVLAHRLYGDARRDADIVTRNRHIHHPGFVPGGVAVEYLRD